MAERRSIGDAMEMTPAKLAFIKGETVQQSQAASKQQPTKSETEGKTIDVPRSETTTDAAKDSTRRTQRRQSLGTRGDRPERGDVLDQVLVPKTIRLPHRIVQALDRAYLEQKLKYAKPDKLQEIAEEALTEWLRKSGYLDS